MKKITLFTVFLLLCNFMTKAQRISANQGWSVTIPVGTITEAGSDYTTPATSATTQTLIDFKTGGASSYTISVQKVDIDWHPNLTLWVQRNGDGNGSGGKIVPMTGGEVFIQVTNAPQLFFFDASGESHNRNNVPVQYQIIGYSVLLPVKTYTTTVVYTISN
jgi:hypothetical protein